MRSVVPVSTTSAMTSATPRCDGGLDGAVQAHDLGVDALLGEVLGDEPGVRGGDALARDVVDVGHVPGLAA